MSKKLKVFVVGASGFLGTKIYNGYLNNPNFRVTGSYSNRPRNGLLHLDVTNLDQVKQVLSENKPDIVVHTVALSDPDYCEVHPENAQAVNFLGTNNIITACQEIGVNRLDYISTVYVFDGQKGNYLEEDDPNPINTYGNTKYQAEQVVSSLPKHGIYRFDKLFGHNGLQGPNEIFDKLDRGKEIPVNNTQQRQPLLIDDMARALRFIQENDLVGTFHLAQPERMTRYQLTLELAKLVEKENLVVPIGPKDQAAQRPPNSSIVTTKIESLGFKFTSFNEALTHIRKSLAYSSQ